MLRLTIAALLCIAMPLLAQRGSDGPDRPIDDAEKKTAIEGVLSQINKNYVFPDVAKKMDEAIRSRQKKNEYDSITSSREFAKVLTEHLRAVCKDRHLSVDYFSEPQPKPDSSRPSPSPEQQARFRQRMGQRNFGFKKAERLDGGIGLLELQGFARAEDAAETAAAAMNFLANSSALIIDLRKNGGGDAAMVILLCSYFFDEQTHLNDIYNRSEDSTRQYWSHPHVAGKKFLGKDVYILTAKRTFSAAEEFAYNMKAQKRATIVGETTGGGAHPTSGHWAAEHFGVAVPFARSINPVTKTNWEGTGVKPDVDVPADQALQKAQLMILKRELEKNAADKEAVEQIKKVIETVQKDLDAIQLSASRVKEKENR
jgi:hypothetical protein